MSDDQNGIEVSDLGEISSTGSEVKPEDVGALSLRYVEGVAQLVVSGGRAIPAKLPVFDETASQVAAYAAGEPTRTRNATVGLPEYGSTQVEIDDNGLYIYREQDILARIKKN